ncbi:unnamed protein product [Caenorhabditis angaria]|uniref:Uncharacterized protein n=1 Tax=Caenorhabditis angaria TaxID=860376 RepID=A0A9P1N479_9PELO|nr:unnamed protein product [Caenorhabditis angaria]
MNTTFVILSDISRQSTVIVSYITCFVSTISVCLAVYLIKTESLKEKKVFQNALIYLQISLYISQTFWGTCCCAIFYFPFPAFISHGLLKNVLPFWVSGGIWGVLFTFYIQSSLNILLVRLSIVVRPDSPFNFNKMSTFIFLMLYLISLVSFMLVLDLQLNFTHESMLNFLSDKYPGYIYIANIYGAMIFSEFTAMKLLFSSMLGFAIFILISHSIFRYLIYYEIKMQVNKMSNFQQKYHMRIAKTLSIFVLIYTLCIAFYLLWSLVSNLLDSMWNTIRERYFGKVKIFENSFLFAAITSTFHTIFVGSPIAGTIYMISSNTAYLRRVKQLLRLKSEPNIRHPTIAVFKTSNIIT